MPLIDPNILFTGGSPAALGLGQGIDAYNQARQQAIENALKQQQIDLQSRQVGVQERTADANLQQAQDLKEAQSIVNAANMVAPLLKSNDPAKVQQAASILAQRTEQLSKQGLNADDTHELLSAINAGDMEYANALVDGAMRMGQMLGITGTNTDVQSSEYIPGLGFATVNKTGQVNLSEFTPSQQKLIQEAQQRESDRKIAESGGKAQAQTSAELTTRQQYEPTLRGDIATSEQQSKDVQARRDQVITQGVVAQDQIGTINKLIELNKDINGGKLERWKKNATDLFGITDPQVGQFDNLSRKLVLDNMKALGANPTEGERAFILSTVSTLESGTAVNAEILNNMKRVAERQAARARRVLSDKKLDPAELILLDSGENDFKFTPRVEQLVPGTGAGRTPAATMTDEEYNARRARLLGGGQ